MKLFRAKCKFNERERYTYFMRKNVIVFMKYSITNEKIISCYVVLYKPKTWCKFCS